MEKVWLNSYPQGVAAEVDYKAYPNISSVFEEAFARYGKRGCVHNMGKTLTYGEMEGLTRSFASFLQNQLGLQKGDRVALMMPNILQYPIALFGILRAGLVAVNVNPLYSERELEHQLDDAGAETIVIFENSAHILAKVLDRTSVKNVILTGIGDMLGFPKAQIVNFMVKHVKKMVPEYDIPNALWFRDVLNAGDPELFRRVETTLEDLAFLQYTGGTTGVSKGAELTHGNIVANICQARAWLEPVLSKTEQEIIITPLPLYHIFSLTANCFVFGSIGALNVFITNPRDMDGFVKELSKWKFTCFTGVNTLFNGLVNHSGFKELSFDGFKLALGGGMAVQKAVAERWKEITGTPLIEAYGLTETSPAACINPLDLPDYNGSIGLPIPSTEVTIKDDDGKDLAIGEVGEICIRGPQVMRGYWNREEETEKVMTQDGFFKTGDIGLMNEQGFFKIVDRKKDMILVSGFNVYPNEIEDVIITHPGVFECAAIGVPDPKSGEAVKIFIVKREENLTEDDIKSYCKDNLTGYKRPRFIEFRKDLPKSNVGKILRKDLRAQEEASKGQPAQ